MTDKKRVEAYLRDRGASLDDRAWLSTRAEADLRTQLQADARADRIPAWTRSPRFRALTALAALITVALLAGIWMQAGGPAPPHATWTLYDTSGRPLNFDQRGADPDPFPLPAVLIEITLPVKAPKSTLSVTAIASNGQRLSLTEGTNVTFPAGGGSRMFQFELPDSLGESFHLSIALDGVTQGAQQVTRAQD